MGTDKVIFVGEEWGATGSHVIGRGPVRNRKYVMRNRKFRNAPSGDFSPEVTSVIVCTCATGTFCITTRVVVQVSWLPVTEGVEGCAHAQPEVAEYPHSGAFSPEVGYRK